MNKTNKKLVVVIVALALALVASFGGTLALLTAKTDGLINTFEAVKGLIDNAATNFTLKESKINADLTVDTETKVGANSYSGFIPGQTLTKDARIAVTSNFNAAAIVYVEIVETNNKYTKSDASTPKLITYAVDTTKWDLVEGLTGAHGGAVYVYTVAGDSVLEKGTQLTSTGIFVGDRVTVANYDTTAGDTLSNENTVIALYGYAVQALSDNGSNFTDMGAAYMAGAFGGESEYVAP